MTVVSRCRAVAANEHGRLVGPGCALWTCAFVVTMAGCSALPFGPSAIADVRAERLKRATEAAAAFEVKRSNAEYEAALSHWRNGNADACRDQLDSLLARKADHRQALLLRTEVALQMDQPGEVVQRLQSQIEKCPGDAELTHTLGVVHDALGETGLARDCFRRATQLEPNNELYALSCQEEQATDADPNAALVSWQEEEPTDSEGRETSAASPADVDGALRQAIQALKESQPAQAVLIVEQALETQSATGALFRVLGAAHYRLGDYASAQEALAESLSLDKAHPLTYFLMGCTLSKLGQPQAADDHFRQAHRLDARYKLAE